MAATEMTDEKRRLLQESERFRQSMGAEFQNVKVATAWVPKTVGVVRATSPFLALATPLIGLFFRRKKKDQPKVDHHHNGKSEQGLVAKALLAFEIFRKARPFFEHFQRSRQRHAENAKATQARSSGTVRK